MAARRRLLLLHGRNSSSEVSEMQAMLLGLEEVVSLSFLDAPHAAAKYDPSLSREGRSWLGADDDLMASLRHVISHCKEHGPFDGAYGFSQACGLLALLSDPAVLSSMQVETPLWKFVVCVCGTPQLMELQNSPRLSLPIQMPSFHLHGEKDAIRPDSIRLSESFADPIVRTHPAGHSVPLEICQMTQLLGELHSFIKQPRHTS